MNKDKEVELKKLEIEKAKVELEKVKVLEGYFRTLAIIVLTTGAGIGTLIKMIYPGVFTKKLLLIGLLVVFFIFAFSFGFIWLKLQKKIKEMEKWIH